MTKNWYCFHIMNNPNEDTPEELKIDKEVGVWAVNLNEAHEKLKNIFRFSYGFMGTYTNDRDLLLSNVRIMIKDKD